MNFTVKEQALERKITRALEQAPELHIPDDFAAKLASQRPPLPAAPLTPPCYGRNVAIVCMAVLLVTMLVFARHLASRSLLWTSLEWILCAQFIGLAFWLMARNLGQFIYWRI
jgi:hypothetical protein